jgi:hypothetical protein
MDYINKNTFKIIETLKVKELYFNEIYEKSGIKSKNNLLKNLVLLTENNILIKKKNKSNTFYSLNFLNQVTLSLLDILDKEKLENFPFEIKKSILESLYLLKPKIAILFGSYAKSNFKKQSDIDILFVDSNKSKSEINNINNNYGVLINPVFIDFKEFNINNDSIIHILKTGFPLVGKEYFYNEKRKV